jgi:hypothetical protein
VKKKPGKVYVAREVGALPSLERWDDVSWDAAEVLAVDIFRPEGTDHRPVTQAKALYDNKNIYVLFHVQDRYVRSVCTQYNGPVYRDSCVEWFVRPRPDKGYFNFELNCGGTLHCSYIEDTERTPAGFKKFALLPEDFGRKVMVSHSMPPVVEPELPGDAAWTAGLRVPLEVLESFAGPLGRLKGQKWRANFYKCGDGTSHPHWASWAPLRERNFHSPEDFGTMTFA